jgi:hypothetical protein
MVTCFTLVSFQGKYYGILIEGESFENKGGWIVDPQFVEQMGAPYLLAHVLGPPVENAQTEIQSPSKGKYHVWVRTKNWVPGDWNAPGRFKLVVNQIELKHTLGTIKNWNWQYAGEIEINDYVESIEFLDLTGFEGRCDAIYFCTK